MLNQYTLGRNETEADEIASYVEWQCAKDNERVTYLEKVQWRDRLSGNPGPENVDHCVNDSTEGLRF